MVRGPYPVGHPSWVISLVLHNLLGTQWSPSGHTRCAVLLRDACLILALLWLGALGYSMLCLFLALFPGAGVWCPLLLSRVLWRRLRPLPCSSVCGLHCTGPTDSRQSQWETVISCAGGQVFPGPLRLHIVSDASSSTFAARYNRRELSKTSVSF